MGFVVPFARPGGEKLTATCRCGQFTFTSSIVGCSAGAPCCGDTVTIGGGSFTAPRLPYDWDIEVTDASDPG